MILSYFFLDSRRPEVRQCLANAHDMHRSIMSGFLDISSATPRRDHGVLYRLMPKKQRVELYVLSREYPDWTHMSAGFSLVDEPKDITSTVDSLRNGRHFGFDIVAVASKKQASGGINSRRVFLPTSEERYQWLLRKAEQNGFSVIWAREEGQVKSFVRAKKGYREAVHTGVRFRGELVVTDDNAFQEAFCNGIGAGKAYGMGMLMLFPLRR